MSLGRKLGGSLLAFTVVAGATAANACLLIPPPNETEAERVAAARLYLDNASVIIEGEVTKAQTRQHNSATIKATRIIKGPARTTFIVESETSCDVPLNCEGRKGRFILHGGPDTYRFSMTRFPDDLLDQLLGSSRAAGRPKIR